MALHMTDAGNQSALPPQQSYYPSANLGTAVSSSMHLTNSSHDSDVGAASGYKMDQELQYYSVGVYEASPQTEPSFKIDSSVSFVSQNTSSDLSAMLNDSMLPDDELLFNMDMNNDFNDTSKYPIPEPYSYTLLWRKPIRSHFPLPCSS